MVVEHVLMCFFACFDLCYQPPPGLGKVAHTTADEIFPPFMLTVVCARRSSTGSDTEEDADISPWPFIAYCFVENLRARIVFAGTLVEKCTLANLNGLEGESGR